MTVFDFEVAFASDAVVGEGPFWDGERLLWVDLTEGRLHTTDLDEGKDEVLEFGGVLGAAVPRRGGGIMAITDAGYAQWDDTGLRVVDPVTADPTMRMNDGKCDSNGRFWGGSVAFSQDVPVGVLYAWEPDTGARAVDSGFVLPNGMGWSPDDSVFYFVDSAQRALYAYDFDAAGGTVANRRLLRTFAAEDGLPDGLAVDADGTLWIAFFDGWSVQRVAPDGRTIETIRLPVSRPTSCAFGDGTDLYVTSARLSLTPDDLVRQPDAGSVFRIDAPAPGVPVSRSL